jgi:membrane-bound lytic murein transglycosylase D
MKQLISSILFLSITFSVFAFPLSNKYARVMPMQRIAVAGIDTLGQLDTFKTYPDEVLDDIFTEKMDIMISNWYIKNAYNIDSMVIPDTTINRLMVYDENSNPETSGKALPDSIYIERLASLNSYIDLSFNKTVRNMIILYTDQRRNQVEIMLGLANYYFPIFEEILDKYEMPLELKYMAIIESALNARAFSKAGACGLWQFMYGTGKMYGLEVSTYIDERKDPLKATDAAARYLFDLYKIYHNWHLVIAAYNCGPGNVNRAIRRSGGKKDYWTIYYRLPRETRGYVPAFIAATYVMNFYKLHDLTPRQPAFDIVTDTIMVSNYLHFEQVATQLELDIDLLREINPMFRRDIIPATPDSPYPLRLPQQSVSAFIDMEQHIFSYKRETFFPNNQIKNPSQTAYHYTPVDVKGKSRIYYKVKSGDNVGFIAEWFKVRASDVRYWNNIRGNLIRVGQKLVIYVPTEKADYYKKFDSMSHNEKQKANGTKQTSTQSSPSKTEIDPTFEYYTVRKGDNLWTIAKKYPGLTAQEIQRLNNISNTKGLDIGQKLKIRKK